MSMSGKIVNVERFYDANRLNEILNHPSVRPFVAEDVVGRVDVGATVKNKDNVLLLGQHGGCLMVQLVPGVYEVHTQVLPEGRGEWTEAMLHSVKHYMFTRTNCFEGLTRVPEGHVAARSAALQAGMKPDWTRPACKWNGKTVPFTMYSITIQDWVRKAPRLEDIGREFHDFLHENAERLRIGVPLHGEDQNHNRYVGASLEMAMNGQILKGVTFYNRWAIASRHSGATIVSCDPPIVRFDIGYLHLKDGRLSMSATLKEAA